MPLLLLLLLFTVNPAVPASDFSRPHVEECAADDPTCKCPAMSAQEEPKVVMFCPTPPTPNPEVIYSSGEDAFPEQECVKCSLKLNENNTAAEVKFYMCNKIFKVPELRDLIQQCDSSKNGSQKSK